MARTWALAALQNNTRKTVDKLIPFITLLSKKAAGISAALN
ncbi:hypothetical protein [Mucilaginibacter sp.]|nr:hypothetical protein [Mucilaginibacter sp.]